MFTGFSWVCLTLCQLACDIRAQSILGDAQHIRHIDHDIKLGIGWGKSERRVGEMEGKIMQKKKKIDKNKMLVG